VEYNKLRSFQPSNEPYQQSGRELSAKLLLIFSSIGVSRGQRNGPPWLFIYPHEAEQTPFKKQYFSENLVASGIEPGTSGSVVRNFDHKITEAVMVRGSLGVHGPRFWENLLHARELNWSRVILRVRIGWSQVIVILSVGGSAKDVPSDVARH
jgi:hypothetical protein